MLIMNWLAASSKVGTSALWVLKLSPLAQKVSCSIQYD